MSETVIGDEVYSVGSVINVPLGQEVEQAEVVERPDSKSVKVSMYIRGIPEKVFSTYLVSDIAQYN